MLLSQSLALALPVCSAGQDTTAVVPGKVVARLLHCLVIAGPPSMARMSAWRRPAWPVVSLRDSLGSSHRAAAATQTQTAACPSPERSMLLRQTQTKTTPAAVGAAMRCAQEHTCPVACAPRATHLTAMLVHSRCEAGLVAARAPTLAAYLLHAALSQICNLSALVL